MWQFASMADRFKFRSHVMGRADKSRSSTASLDVVPLHFNPKIRYKAKGKSWHSDDSYRRTKHLKLTHPRPTSPCRYAFVMTWTTLRRFATASGSGDANTSCSSSTTSTFSNGRLNNRHWKPASPISEVGRRSLLWPPPLLPQPYPKRLTYEGGWFFIKMLVGSDSQLSDDFSS